MSMATAGLHRLVVNGIALPLGTPSILPPFASLRTASYVKGDLDPTEVASPNVATISNGGFADFRVDVQNLGTALTNAVVYDVLPSVNDTGTLNTAPRGSVFRPTLAGPLVLANPSATAEYSPSANPCKPDVGVTTGCVNDWTTTPASWGAVRAYRVTYPTLAMTSSTSIRFTLNAPVGIAAGDTAWNNAVVTALDGTSQLLPSESPKVGMARPLTDVSLAISLGTPNGLAGQARTVSVTVKHDTTVTTSPSGLLTYSSAAISTARGVRAAVTLPAGVQIVPGSSSALTFNESTRIWNVGDVFVDSQQTLTFQVTAASVGSFNLAAEITANAVTDIDSTPNDCASTAGQDDCAGTTLTTSLPQLALQTQVESTSGSGIFIDANSTGGPVGQYTSGQAVHYRFLITNTGVFDLSNIVLTQAELAGLCDLSVSGSLIVGAVRTIDCVWSPGRAIGTNITTASVSGSISGVTATAADDAKIIVTAPLVVPVPGLTIDVTVTNPTANPVVSNDDVIVRPGDPLAWKYVITNSGTDTLLGFLLTDQNGNHPDLASCVRSDGGSIDDPFLPGIQATCTYPFNAINGRESRTISANLVASSTLATIDAGDSTTYLAGIPSLAVSLKVLDPQTNLYIEADSSDNKIAVFTYGDAVHWQLTVTNTGPINIPDVQIGTNYTSVCARTTLAIDAGASFVASCDSVATAALEEYAYASSNSLQLSVTNVARIRLSALVAVQVLVADGPTSATYIDSTPVFAVGHYSPGDIAKWRVIVTNNGEIDLTQVTLTSEQFPACNQVIARLAVGASQTVNCTSIEWVSGASYARVTTNEHVEANDFAFITMDAPDPADSLVVHLDVQDRPGVWQTGGDYNFATSSYDPLPQFLGSDTIRWRVRVDNPTAFDLTNVRTLTGIPACDQTISTLLARGHAEFECTSDTERNDRYANLYAHGRFLKQDSAYIDVISISIFATVRSPLSGEGENPLVDVDAPIDWHIIIANSTSPYTTLTDVTLEDQFSTSYPLSTCTVSGGPFDGSLLPYSYLDCFFTATALAGGEQGTFTAKATGTATLRPEASDNAGYVVTPPPPAVPSATIDLLVLDPSTGMYVDADDRDQLIPNILSGTTIYWRVVVVNTGTVALTGLSIGDGQTACGPIDANGLAVGATLVQNCTSAGLYTKRAEYRSGNSGIIERTIMMRATDMATASDIARVFIAQPASIGDQVWYDTDGNDAINGDEHGQPGIVVRLYLDGIEIAQATTDANGRYRFENLLPGEYTVTFTIPMGNFVTTGAARATSLGLALAGSLATVHVSVSSGDIRPDISLGVRSEALDVTPTTTTTPPTPPRPTAPARAGLPKTGTDVQDVLAGATLLLIAGLALATLGRRRRPNPEGPGSLRVE
jgi:hypothetical protein